jgi:hypothetical protein
VAGCGWSRWRTERTRIAVSPAPLGLAVESLRPNGHLLAVHWRQPAPHHPRTGDATHQALASFSALTRLAEYHDRDFAAEDFTHAGGDERSVAQTSEFV